jgi:type II secretory ATPase GspE/PulE/Tfp pilus assembly ATPase PilB-like protein
MIKEEDIRLVRRLMSKGHLDKVRIEKFQRMMGGTDQKNTADVLIDALGVSEDLVAEAISEDFNIPFLNLTESMVSLTDKQMKDSFLKKFNALPIIRSGIELTVVFTSPPYKEIVEAMRNETKAFIVPVTAKRSALLSVLNLGVDKKLNEYQVLQSKFALETIDLKSRPKEKVYEVFNSGKLPNVDLIVDELVMRAIKIGATDIYLEPMESEFRVRLNIDGVLNHYLSLPKEMTETICNVLRTRGSLKLFDKKKAQDGRYSSQYGSFSFDFRVNTLPTMEGERYAIRIIRKGQGILDLKEIGFSGENLNHVRHLLNKPRGLLMIAGPSGSGVSTTAYACLASLREEQKSIMTIENPVEFRLNFASQVEIDPEQKMDYAASMRAVLRQHPNVIFLGSIHEPAAGHAAAEAALTGNMVISTVLASDALSVIPRLVNFDIPPSWLAPILNGVIYQHLARRICKYCKVQYKPSEHELHDAGLSQLGDAITLFKGTGCENCSGDGHMGRIAIHEVLPIDEEIKDLIYNEASPVRLREAANRKGFESIRMDAAKKLMAGVISLDEYLRVLG